jgi:TetR/AcrR family transcriptional regulator of autoinduction and epiphytic fitness
MTCIPSILKMTFREKQFLAREDAILDAVNQLLSTKGYDLMTVDEVAAAVGIAKGSLYKHFDSKESLAAAAMIRLMDQTLTVIESLSPDLSELDKLRAIIRWAIMLHLQRAMPLLSSTSHVLKEALSKNKDYLMRLMTLSDVLGGWIVAAQAAGILTKKVPPEVILYSVFARACDPVADVLQAAGQLSDDEIADMLLEIYFDGVLKR